MALINCPDCGKEVSDSAKNCIHCGCVLKQNFVKCPECGNEAPEGTKTCANCGFVFRKEDSAQKVVVLKEAKATGKKLLIRGLIVSLSVIVIALIVHFITLSGNYSLNGFDGTRMDYFKDLDLGGQIFALVCYICRFLSLGTTVLLLAKPKFRKKLWIVASAIISVFSLVHLVWFDIPTEGLACIIIFFPIIIAISLLLQIISLFVKDE